MVGTPTESGTGNSLGEYIRALISVLGVEDPAALERMRAVVRGREARIVLDDEAVEVGFFHGPLQLRPVSGGENQEGATANLGVTDSRTVLDLLDGYLEVTDAILDGRLRIAGEAEDVVRMLVAIEILLDASPRSPALQALASRFQSARRKGEGSTARGERGSWYPFACGARERDLLSQLDLLPEAGGPRRGRRQPGARFKSSDVSVDDMN